MNWGPCGQKAEILQLRQPYLPIITTRTTTTTTIIIMIMIMIMIIIIIIIITEITISIMSNINYAFPKRIIYPKCALQTGQQLRV